MLQRLGKFIILPVALMVFGVVFGSVVQRHDLAFEVLVAIYLLWNSYHFGMQHFGLLALVGQRAAGFWVACATILCMSVMPLTPIGNLNAIVVTMMAVNFFHWFSDIGLSMRVVRRWWFLPSVLVIGMLGFTIKSVHGGHSLVSSVPIILSIRIFAGFNHFLFSRWVWQLSN